jgi:anti-sigma-K factor RskA
MRCTHIVETGAYVLGALAPAERSTFERHLATCGSCRNEVAELAGLPGLLGRLDADVAASIGEPAESSPPSVLDTTLANVRTERQRTRRRRRWERGVTVAAAACLAVVIGAGVSTVSLPAAPSPVLAAMSPVTRDTSLTALVGYWADPRGGTDIRMTCAYSSAGPSDSPDEVTRFDLWVFPRDGGAGRSVWFWDAGPGYRDTFWSESDLRPDQIGRLEVRHGSTVVLVYQAT